MAHCRGDFEGSWVVLSILQCTADGELADVKAPRMEVLVRRSWQEAPKGFASPFASQSQQQAAAAAGAGNQAGDQAAGKKGSQQQQQQQWVFLKTTNQFPEHGDVQALVELMQQHVPQLLNGPDDSSGGGQQQQGSMTGRQLCFSWGSPWLNAGLSGQAGAAGAGDAGWYVDLLQPAAERLGTGGSSGCGEGGMQLPLPPGVLSFDDLMAAAPQQRP